MKRVGDLVREGRDGGDWGGNYFVAVKFSKPEIPDFELDQVVDPRWKELGIWYLPLSWWEDAGRCDPGASSTLSPKHFIYLSRTRKRERMDKENDNLRGVQYSQQKQKRTGFFRLIAAITARDLGRCRPELGTVLVSFDPLFCQTL